MVLDHIGYAVNDMGKASAVMQGLGFTFPREAVLDTGRNLYIRFGYNGACCVELIARAGASTPIDAILKKMGSTPYHLCYRTEDMEAEILHLRACSFALVAPPALAPAFDAEGGCRVAFLANRYIGLIELVEYGKDADDARKAGMADQK